MSDSVRVKLLKTKKIDVRLDQELFDLVDTYAQSSRLSRAQVVERALLQLFGRPVMDDPITQGTAAPQKSPSKPSKACPPVGAEIATLAEHLGSGPSTAKRPSSRQTG